MHAPLIASRMQPGEPTLTDVYEAARAGESRGFLLLHPFVHGAQTTGDGTVTVEIFPDGPTQSFETEGVELCRFCDIVHEWLTDQTR